MSQVRDWHSVFGAACSEQRLSHLGTALSVAPNGVDTLFHVQTDQFSFSSKKPKELSAGLEQWLKYHSPTVIHVHHYLNLGVEILRVIKNACPNSPIVVTLHEFLAICGRDGQMIKADGRLCYRETPAECSICLPKHTPQDFFLRKLYIKSYFDLVDCFIAPSKFLRERYINWGIPAHRITMIENALDNPGISNDGRVGALSSDIPSSTSPVRFGYFGQITPYKGVELLVEAFNLLPEEWKQRAELEINGGGHERFSEDFKRRIENVMNDSDRRVQFCGPYDACNVQKLMSRVDWVVVPSRWWENSPMVIQEAFALRKPVICGDVGGMAEKVLDGTNGLHFSTGSVFGLKQALERAIQSPAMATEMARGINPPLTGLRAVAPFVRLYEGLLESRIV